MDSREQQRTLGLSFDTAGRVGDSTEFVAAIETDLITPEGLAGHLNCNASDVRAVLQGGYPLNSYDNE